MSDLTPEKLAELRADIAALPEGMHHPHWSGNTDNPGHMELSAWVPGWGRTSLMRPTRWGMQGAKFQFLNPDTVTMEDADRLVKFEVGNPNVTGAHRRDGSVYRGNIAGIDHPVARLIVAALEYIPALLDAAEERDEIAGRLAHLLCDLTGGRMSKTSYPVPVMAWEIEQYLSECHESDLKDERDAFGVAIERVRALHTPSRWYLDYCDDPACEREHVECNGNDLFHDDDYRLVCETCSGGELEDTDDPTPYPCPTSRALNESETDSA